MKKVIVILSLVFALTGCEQFMDGLTGKDVFDHIREPPNTFTSLDEAGRWIRDNIRYDFNKSDANNWQSPSQTYYSGKGVCVDYAILLMWYAHEFGVTSELVAVKMPSGSNHALVRMNGRLYDAQGYTTDIMPYAHIMYTKSFEDTLNYVYYECGNRSLELD